MTYRSLYTTVALALSAASTFATVPAMAQEATVSFNVPAGPLGEALARIGQQAGVIVSVEPTLVRDKRAAELRGNHTAPEALRRTLSSSGLEAQSDGRGGYRVIAVPIRVQQTTRSATSVPLPPSIQTGTAEPRDETDRVVIVGALTDVELTNDDITFRQVNDLSDLFRQVPSVTVGGSVSIAQKIYVRGLEDNMLNVTVDGAPQRGTLFHHIGRVSIEPELLETVDVQAGAGEATSGFGAIGGSIRFRTRNPVDMLRPDQSVGGIAKAGWFSNDGYKLHGTVYGRLFGDIGAIASYTYVDRNNIEEGGGEELLGTAAKQQLGFLKVGGELEGGHRISISYEHRKEEASFGQRPNWPVLVGDPLFPAEAERQTATLNYGYSLTDNLDIETTGYWTESSFVQDVYTRWGPFGGDITSAGFDVRGRLRWDDHDLIIGGEFRDDTVTSEYLADPSVWSDWAWDPNIGNFKETGNVLGIYAQDHWRPTDALTVSYGLRYDSYDLELVTYGGGAKSDGVSWNAGLEYDLTDDFQFTASFAEALRGKEIGDAFTIEKNPSRISLQPGLRPEKVDNYEAGLSFDRDGFRASAAYYNMLIEDVILDQIGGGPAPQAANYFENVGSFRAEGVELRAGFTNGPFSVDAYFNHYRSKLNGNMLEGYEHIGLGNSVGDNWNITLGYAPMPELALEASVTQFADLNNIEVLHRNVEIGWIDSTRFVDKPGYTVLDLFARWQPLGDDQVTLLAGVYNVFDERYRAHSSVADYSAIPDYEGVVGVREPGRDIRLTASFRY